MSNLSPEQLRAVFAKRSEAEPGGKSGGLGPVMRMLGLSGSVIGKLVSTMPPSKKPRKTRMVK